ncbi:hypothetical protein HGRIS_002297 [Hohenbuehelia grisea]|uniref:Uncharacterized protein n=1 Tax=Hohenbuehelia grisea TaxID=104357 RepID=A0ABR3JK70_9AGAR
MKRKFEFESDDVTPTKSKQLKLVPFPNYEPDTDVAMSDAEPLRIETHHTRLSSNASTLSSFSESPLTQSPYLNFDAHPLPAQSSVGSPESVASDFSYGVAQTPSSPSVGLLQPSTTFVHHGSNCYQIPKLRVACASGPNGSRTMWSFCEQCGAISMVDND